MIRVYKKSGGGGTGGTFEEVTVEPPADPVKFTLYAYNDGSERSVRIKFPGDDNPEILTGRVI